MSHASVPVWEFPVPKTIRAVIGSFVGAMFLSVFILFSVLLAIYNLCTWTAIIPSMIWLLLVGLIAGNLIKSKERKQFAIDVLGSFSRKEFIRAIATENGETTFQYGFKMFGKWFLYFAVAVRKIEAIEWNTGQASHFAGKDMDDWHVVVWYDHDDPAKSQQARSYKSKKPDQELFIVGMSGKKETTGAFGHALLGLLRDAGADFSQGENGCSFVRQLPGGSGR